MKEIILNKDSFTLFLKLGFDDIYVYNQYCEDKENNSRYKIHIDEIFHDSENTTIFIKINKEKEESWNKFQDNQN